MHHDAQWADDHLRCYPFGEYSVVKIGLKLDNDQHVPLQDLF